MRILLFTDAHYAQGLTTCGTRTCYQSLDKLRRIAAWAGPVDAYLNLGDLINDAGDDGANRANLARAQAALAALGAPYHSLAGNHDVEVAQRSAFTGRDTDWFSFEGGGLEWLALDCNYTPAGARCAGRGFDWRETALPAAELDWLGERLVVPGAPVVILSHHPLLGYPADPHVIRNQAALARAVRAARRPVRALLSGHFHRGAQRALDGIPAPVFPALCEGDACPCALISAEGGYLQITAGECPPLE